MRQGGYQIQWLTIALGSVYVLGCAFWILQLNGRTCIWSDGRVAPGGCHADPTDAIAAVVIPLVGMVVGILIVWSGIKRPTHD